MAIDYNRKNKSFYVQEYADSVLVAFVPETAANRICSQIAREIYSNTFDTKSLAICEDASEIYDRLRAKGFKYDPNSLVVIKIGNSIQYIYGQDIFPEYESKGQVLKLYHKDKNHLAISVNLPSQSRGKLFLYGALCLLAVFFTWQIVDRSKEQSHEEEQSRVQYENKLLRDSLKCVISKKDSVTSVNTSLIKENKLLADENQIVKDSLTSVITQKDDVEITDNEAYNNVEMSSKKSSQSDDQVRSTHNVSSKPQSQRASQTRQDQDRRKNSEEFSRLVDRGNNFASSYYTYRKESDRRKAIEAYESAVKLRRDSEIIEKINKLKRVKK